MAEIASIASEVAAVETTTLEVVPAAAPLKPLKPKTTTLKEGEAFILYVSGETFSARAHKSCTINTRHGIFPCERFIGAPLGSRITGVPLRKVDPAPPGYCLGLTPSLWTASLPHRTQIIYDADISLIVELLELKPGMKVGEAGTGSGSLTHGLASTVIPNGKVVTCDFNKHRAWEACKEFQLHGLEGIVESNWGDACMAAFPFPDSASGTSTTEAPTTTEGGEEDGDAANDDDEEEGDEPTERGVAPSQTSNKKALPMSAEEQAAVEAKFGKQRICGFNVAAGYLDAIFLDVPAPWTAVRNVFMSLKSGGRFCSFSPCIEQTQKLCDAVRESNQFCDIRTIEVLSRDYCIAHTKQSTSGVTAMVKPPTCIATTAAATETESSSKRPREPPAVDAAFHCDLNPSSSHVRPSLVGRGHTAFLTFCRRR